MIQVFASIQKYIFLTLLRYEIPSLDVPFSLKSPEKHNL